MEGNLSIYSSWEKATFTTEYLFWDDEAKTLNGAEDAEVFIRKDDGTQLVGTDFEADIATRSVSFGGPVRGTYVSGEDE